MDTLVERLQEVLTALSSPSSQYRSGLSRNLGSQAKGGHFEPQGDLSGYSF